MIVLALDRPNPRRFLRCPARKFLAHRLEPCRADQQPRPGAHSGCNSGVEILSHHPPAWQSGGQALESIFVRHLLPHRTLSNTTRSRHHHRRLPNEKCSPSARVQPRYRTRQPQRTILPRWQGYPGRCGMPVWILALLPRLLLWAVQAGSALRLWGANSANRNRIDRQSAHHIVYSST